jgi:hypothetical protein
MNIYEAMAAIKIGRSIIDEVKKQPTSKCQCCGHTVILIDRKYNKKVKPYVLHNWRKKCWCGCTTPVMSRKEINDVLNQ